MAASAQDNSKSAVPQTYTNTQGKEGWNITGLHLDGGFGSGQFKNAERKILDATLMAASAQDNSRDASRPLGE
jgi:hypothetical protein